MAQAWRFACIQLNSGADVGANAEQIAYWTEKAVSAGAQVVALPENAYLIEAPGIGHRQLYTESEHPGARHASALARSQGCWLCVGSLAVKVDDSGKAMNRQLWFDPQGHIVHRYDKLHLFDVSLPDGEVYTESSRMLAGDKAVCAPMPWGGTGLSICYDLRFPHLYRKLAREGAAYLFVPSAFTATTGQAHWHVLLRARAIETGCFVLAPAQTGTHPGGRRTYGHALIVDPWGAVVADAGEAPGFVLAELDVAQVVAARQRIPSLVLDANI